MMHLLRTSRAADLCLLHIAGRQDTQRALQLAQVYEVTTLDPRLRLISRCDTEQIEPLARLGNRHRTPKV